jgi:hypothetical protein
MIEAPPLLHRRRRLHQRPVTDGEHGATLMLVPPRDRSDLWTAYRAGAFAAYARHRVEHVLALPEIGYDEDRPWFEVAVDPRGVVLGGLRINGPLHTVREAAALSELADHPHAAAALTRVLRERIEGGIAEVKGFWVRHEEPHRGRIAAALADSVTAIGDVLGVDHLFCTAAEHAVPRWLAAGAQRLDSVPPVPFPDSRYRTTVLWWDRRDRSRP